MRDLGDRPIATHCHVDRNHSKSEHSDRVEPLRTLRPIAEREQETHDKKAKIQIVENHVQHVDTTTKVKGWVFHGLAENHEGNVIVALDHERYEPHVSAIGSSNGVPERTKRRSS